MYISAALVASLALEASAFLVPLEISEAAEHAKSELAALLATTSHNVNLECPGCPFFDGSEAREVVENKIHLEFSIDDQHRLTINHAPMLQSAHNNPPIPYVVSAPQIRVEDGQQTNPIQLDFAWERFPPIESTEEPDRFILPVRFTILGLQGFPVQVDTVAIDLLQTPEQISIARITTIPFKETPGATTCDPASKWSLCRLRAIIATHLQALMEAAKARASAAKGWVTGEGTGKGCGGHRGKFGPKGMGMGRPHHGFPGPHGEHMGGPGPHHGFPGVHGMGGPDHHHHGHHGHHRAHHFGHILHQTLRFFVIPAVLGVIGGLVASAVGMLVGQLIIFSWARFYRNGQRSTQTNTRVVEIVIDEEEKDALILNEDDLRPPEYRDVEAGATDEKH